MKEYLQGHLVCHVFFLWCFAVVCPHMTQAVRTLTMAILLSSGMFMIPKGMPDTQSSTNLAERVHRFDNREVSFAADAR